MYFQRRDSETQRKTQSNLKNFNHRHREETTFFLSVVKTVFAIHLTPSAFSLRLCASAFKIPRPIPNARGHQNRMNIAMTTSAPKFFRVDT